MPPEIQSHLGAGARCSRCLAAPQKSHSPSPSPENPREPHSVTSNFILIPSEKFKNYTKKYFSLCYLLTKNTPQNYKLFSGFAGVGAVGGGGGGWFVHFE